MKLQFIIPLLLLFAAATIAPSCKTKSGCESNQQVQPRVNRKGELKGRRSGSSSQLFDKKMRKRMNK